MFRTQRNKKKHSPSFIDDDESPNISSYQRRPKKTVVIDEECEKIPNENSRRYQQINKQKSSTPNNVNSQCKSSMIKQKPLMKCDSYQDNDSSEDSEYSTDDELNMVQVVSKELIAAREQLKKNKIDLESLQSSFKELEISKTNLDEKVKKREIDYQNLIEENKKLTNQLIELKFTNKDQKLSETTNGQALQLKTSSESSNLLTCFQINEPRVACLICPGKILKNYLGFTIHFGKVHKNLKLEKCSQYAINVKEQNSTTTTNSMTLPQTPQPPKYLLFGNSEEKLINL